MRVGFPPPVFDASLENLQRQTNLFKTPRGNRRLFGTQSGQMIGHDLLQWNLGAALPSIAQKRL